MRSVGILASLVVVGVGCTTTPGPTAVARTAGGKAEGGSDGFGSPRRVLLAELDVVSVDDLGVGEKRCRPLPGNATTLLQSALPWCQLLHAEAYPVDHDGDLGYLAVRVREVDTAVGGAFVAPLVLVGAFVFGIPLALNLHLDESTRRAAERVAEGIDRQLSRGAEAARFAFSLRIPVIERSRAAPAPLTPTVPLLWYAAFKGWLAADDQTLVAWADEDAQDPALLDDAAVLADMAATSRLMEEKKPSRFPGCYPALKKALGDVSPFSIRDLRGAPKTETPQCGRHQHVIQPGCIQLDVAACWESLGEEHQELAILAGPIFTFLGPDQVSPRNPDLFCICYRHVRPDDALPSEVFDPGELTFQLVKGTQRGVGAISPDDLVQTIFRTFAHGAADSHDSRGGLADYPVALQPGTEWLDALVAGSSLVERPLAITIDNLTYAHDRSSIFQGSVLGSSVVIQDAVTPPTIQAQTHIVTSRAADVTGSVH